jgi:hypothetical protein
MNIPWETVLKVLVTGTFLAMLIRKEQRPVIISGVEKLIENATSKRFIVLMIATWFVYQKIPIDGNWLVLAGAYIGLDTINKAGILTSLSDKIKANSKQQNEE